MTGEENMTEIELEHDREIEQEKERERETDNILPIWVQLSKTKR